MELDRYNRNRPFLMITRTMNLNDGVRTEIKGWINNQDSTKITEVHRILDRVNDSHMRDAVVIIDIVKNVCLKNTISDISDSQAISIFLSKYKHDVKAALEAWSNAMANQLATKKIVQKSENNIDGVYGS